MCEQKGLMIVTLRALIELKLKMTEDFAGEARKAYDDNRYKDAIELYQKGIAVEPEAGRLHASLAGVYFTIGDYNNCIAECRKSIQLSVNDARIYGMLANALRKTNQHS